MFGEFGFDTRPAHDGWLGRGRADWFGDFLDRVFLDGAAGVAAAGWDGVAGSGEAEAWSWSSARSPNGTTIAAHTSTAPVIASVRQPCRACALPPGPIPAPGGWMTAMATPVVPKWPLVRRTSDDRR